MPIDDATHQGPGEAERPLDNERLRAKAEFGTTDGDGTVEWLLTRDGTRADEVVS